MTEKLFSEFKPATAAEWKNQLMKELKGEDFETLRWHNENGFVVEPFYTSEDLKQNYEPAFTHSDWHIGVPLHGKGPDPEPQMNADLLKSLAGGATAITIFGFNNRREGEDALFGNYNSPRILQDVRLDYIHSSFYVNERELDLLADYIKTNYPNQELDICLYERGIKARDHYKNWYAKAKTLFPSSKTKLISADATSINSFGSFAHVEVANALAQLVDKIEMVNEHGLPAGDFAVKMSVGSDYFVEIAKFRALRRLWKLIRAEYNISNNLYVMAWSSETNKSVSDRYNNLLRTTVEAMAAVAGGCNELTLSCFDRFFPESTDLAKRMSVNQQHILKYESYFDKVSDIACGSYYIETLTDQIAMKSLEVFKEIERNGGAFNYQTTKEFSEEQEKQAKYKAEKIRSGQEVIIGVNKFRNAAENINIPASHFKMFKELGPHQYPVIQYELKNNLYPDAQNL